jgi:ABC-type glycerol-3-phosphate transport system permease component
MAVAMMALVPPVVIVLLMQRYFMHGLLETEK